MTNISMHELEKITNHKHHFEFYDDHDNTFDTIRSIKIPRVYLPRGTVYECECGAREIRFIVWTGKHDIRKKTENDLKE